MKIEIITRLEEMAAVKKEWNDCLSLSSQNSVFLTFEWFYSWWKSFGEDQSLRILLFRDSRGVLNGIAPMMLTQQSLSFLASREVTDYCDLIIPKGKEEEVIESFLIEIMANRGEMDRLALINIREESSTIPVLTRLAEKFDLPFTLEETEFALRLELPKVYESYVSQLSRKNRHELRRKVKKLEELSDVVIERISDPEKIRIHLETFIGLHRRSSPAKNRFWQKKGMAGFFEDVATFFSQQGWMEFYLLSMDGQITASLLCFIYQNEVLFYNVAFDPNFAAFSPGIFLFNRAIERAIAEGIWRVDFLRGREKYKYNFGAEECKIRDFVLSLREK